MKHLVVLVMVTGVIAGCAQPGGPAQQATDAGAVAVPAATPPRPGRRASVCTVSGFTYLSTSTTITPAMTASSGGGSCNASMRTRSSVAIDMSVARMPQHGTLTTGGAAMLAALQYTPTPGYEGPDSFAVTTGVRGRITAEFAVTVVRAP